MKLTLALLTTALAALVAAQEQEPTLPPVDEANATPALFDLSIDNSATVLPDLIWNNLMFYNGTAFVGDIKYDYSSEPLLITGGPVQYGHTFTSFHQPPTGWRNFYVIGNDSKPIGFTTPHSAYRPPGAVETGFGSFGGKLKLKDGKKVVSKWKACKAVDEKAWEIYWEGGEELKDCTKVELKVGEQSECRYPKYVAE